MTRSHPFLFRFGLALLAALLPLQVPLASERDSLAEARDVFKRAYALAGAGGEEQPEDPETLRNYPLFPYVQRARLERALTRAGGGSPVDAEVRKFLEKHDADPVGRALRRAWLESLARREQWKVLVEQYREDLADTTLRCQHVRGRIAVAGSVESALEQVEPAAIELWLTPRRLPQECEPVFEWLRNRGSMTVDLIEKRVRLLLENNQPDFARLIARRLPAARAESLNRWAALIERPAVTFDALLQRPADRETIEPAALLAGWTRLTRGNAAEAIPRYEALLAKGWIDAAQASRFALALAMGLAWDRRPEALEYFARVAPGDFDDNARAWQARAALWAGNWKQAEQAIAAMSERQRGEARWRYWSARAAEQLGDEARARSLYTGLLANDNFYAAQAAARLGRPATPNPSPLELENDVIQQIAARPHFVRARELLLSEMRSDAVNEWLAGAAMLDDGTRTQAIHLASRWGLHDVSIAAAARQRIFNDYELLYPRPFDDSVKSAASRAALPMPILYGLIRQESLFRHDAVSHAGAVGLAQLLPETARIVARQSKLPAPRRHDLFDPHVNVRLGASYLRRLVDRFDGQIFVALAGYNAGPNAAARWLPPEPIDADVWIENIPYNETREYVQRIMWHSVVFGWLMTGKPQDTSTWPRQVAPIRRTDGTA